MLGGIVVHRHSIMLGAEWACSLDLLELEEKGGSIVSRRSAVVIKKKKTRKEKKRKTHLLHWRQYAGLGGLIIFAGMQGWVLVAICGGHIVAVAGAGSSGRVVNTGVGVVMRYCG